MGDPITWTYKVTNTGECDLSDVVVTDDEIGAVGTIRKLCRRGASDTLSMPGMAIRGCVRQRWDGDCIRSVWRQGAPPPTPRSYFGSDPTIAIDKVTVDNGVTGDGLFILAGEPIGWRYTVTNAGNVALSRRRGHRQSSRVIPSTSPVTRTSTACST